ncbi:MAG: hypothetical protein HQ541_22555 [Mariniphaga sp.]|nr:hypothetical protein [Mariniphaga sp.]
MDFNSVIYTDEVEIMANPKMDQDLGIHFNGIYFETKKALGIKQDLIPIVKIFGCKVSQEKIKKVFQQLRKNEFDINQIEFKRMEIDEETFLLKEVRIKEIVSKTL